MNNFTNIKIFTKGDVHFPEVEVEAKKTKKLGILYQKFYLRISDILRPL